MQVAALIRRRRADIGAALDLRPSFCLRWKQNAAETAVSGNRTAEYSEFEKRTRCASQWIRKRGGGRQDRCFAQLPHACELGVTT